MSRVPTQDGRKRRVPGDFQRRHEQLRARAKRHASILEAVEIAQGSGSATLKIDGYLVELTTDPSKALSKFYETLEIIRTKSFGLRLAVVNEKDVGFARLIGVRFEDFRVGLRSHQTVAYVSAISKDGVAVEEWWWIR